MMRRTSSNPVPILKTWKHRVPAMVSGVVILFLRAVRTRFHNGGPPLLKRPAPWLLLELSAIVFTHVGSKLNGEALLCRLGLFRSGKPSQLSRHSPPPEHPVMVY